MFSKRLQIFLSGVMLALVVLRPNIPVLAGVVLLTLIMTGAQSELSAKSSRKRWAAFKRMMSLCIVGSALIFAGIGIKSAPWQLSVTNADQTRQAMSLLAIYATAIIGAPALAWVQLSHRSHAPKRMVARKTISRTLPHLACAESIRRVQIAV